MSNYRRLISYIYAYEGGIKGKNVGYAKIEVRGGQCKLAINVKKIYVGSNDTGVFLLANQKEIYLGNIFIRNGGGEFRTVFAAANMDGNGLTIDQCYGLTMHEVENTWQAYTTIWEDAVTHAAEIELAEVTAENRIRQTQKENQRENHHKNRHIDQDIDAELTGDDLNEEIVQAEEVHSPIRNLAETEAFPSVCVPEGPPEDQQMAEEAAAPESSESPLPGPPPSSEGVPSEPPPSLEEVPSPLPSSGEVPPEAPLSSGGVSPEPPPGQVPLGQQPAGPGNPSELEALDLQEMRKKDHDTIWSSFQRKYPKLRVFDYQYGCEILSICPQDLGLLPREVWTYGNNSFLLHGYYNYRYLVIARLNNPGDRPRYLLGVPGHYYSNEKYMAAMFGFPNFVLAKNQPQRDGRFGYWYTDVRI